MSDMKHDALVDQGIEIMERLDIPDELIPEDAHVEMEAKKAAGYFTSKLSKADEDLNAVVGRKIKE
jgi:hypothetical protein